MNKLTLAFAVGLAGAASAANLRAENQISVSNRAFLAYAKEKYDCTVAGNDLEATANDILSKATAASSNHDSKCAADDQQFTQDQDKLKSDYEAKIARTAPVKAEEFEAGNNAKHAAADKASEDKMTERKQAAADAVTAAQGKESDALKRLSEAETDNSEKQAAKSKATGEHTAAFEALQNKVPESKNQEQNALQTFASDLAQEKKAAEDLARAEIEASGKARDERKAFCTKTKAARQAVIDADNKALANIKPLLAKLAENGCQTPSDLTSGASVPSLLETASHMTAEIQAKCDAITAQILMNGPSTFLEMAQKGGADPTHAFSASFDEWGKSVANDQADADKVEKECNDEADRVYNDEVDNKSGGHPLKDNGENAAVRYEGAHNLVKAQTIADSQKKHDDLKAAEEQRHADLVARLTKAEADTKVGKEAAIKAADAASSELTDATTSRDQAVAERQQAEKTKVTEDNEADKVFAEEKSKNLKMYETNPAANQDQKDKTAYESADAESKAEQADKKTFCAATAQEYSAEIETVNQILSEMGKMSSGAKAQ